MPMDHGEGPEGPPATPVGPAAYCPDCAVSGSGACDAYPECPAGRALENQWDEAFAQRQAKPVEYIATEHGAWQCSNGHMFRYEPPPASPPWCAKTGCQAVNFRWIIKDEVTER